MKPVVIVQHEPSVPPGSIVEVLADEGVEHLVLDAWRSERWPSIDRVGGLVVLGGTMNVDQLEAYPFLARSRALMAAALETELPTLGVCLGAQMMARVLGAEVHRAEPRNAFFSPLQLTDEGTTDEVLRSFAEGTPVLQFHEDTFVLPERATLLATSGASHSNQAFRYGHNAYAVQFHFEVDREILQRWIDDIGADALREEWGTARDDLLRAADGHLATQARAGRDLVHAFLAGLV